MKILVVGNGGREHAIAWKLLQSPQVKQVFCTPGNGGTATLPHCQNVPIKVDDFEGMNDLVNENHIDLIVVGPEVPLSLGITDYFQAKNRLIFGPNQEGAQIEASKSWAKKLMIETHVPTAEAEVFTDINSAKDYLRKKGTPIVVKADGLAAGKGVTVATNLEMAENAINSIFSGEFGQENLQVVIEEFLTGQEVSVLALTDGKTIIPLLPAQDHKAIGDGDQGANTGGMGAYTPAPIITPTLMNRIQKEVLEPTLQGLQKRGIDYRGILYAGLMITPNEDIKVLEFNCRFGDPETQPILSMLETPLVDILLACCHQKLDQLPPLRWRSGASVCVVLAAQGYPGNYEKGQVITGIPAAENSNVTVFHAGTQLKNGQILTDGGRVLGVTAWGNDFQSAINNAYEAVDFIHFDGVYYRRDIGHRVLKLGAVN